MRGTVTALLALTMLAVGSVIGSQEVAHQNHFFFGQANGRKGGKGKEGLEARFKEGNVG